MGDVQLSMECVLSMCVVRAGSVCHYEWQVEQLPPEQEPQLEEVLEEASRRPLDCTANALKSLVTLSLLQAGHSTASSADLIKTSKSERHCVQLYSYRGMNFLVLSRACTYFPAL